MMELFGNPGLRFFDAYREHFPLDGGYSARRDLYNLYHLLNHANLFGGAYAGRAQQLIERLLAHLR
jgi:protein-ribulosamine 3-kinase